MGKDEAIAIINTIRTTAVFFINNGHKIKQLWESFSITKAAQFTTQISSLVVEYNDAIDEIVERLEEEAQPEAQP